MRSSYCTQQPCITHDCLNSSVSGGGIRHKADTPLSKVTVTMALDASPVEELAVLTHKVLWYFKISSPILYNAARATKVSEIIVYQRNARWCRLVSTAPADGLVPLCARTPAKWWPRSSAVYVHRNGKVVGVAALVVTIFSDDKGSHTDDISVSA